MIYVDTSVLVALFIHEPRSDEIAKWYARCNDELVSTAWCVTEFASALGIKQRTQQISSDQANAAWVKFERLCGNDLQLLQLERATFHRAALLALDHATKLRAGDSLHLAAALDIGVEAMASIDEVLSTNAQGNRLKLVFSFS
jgi:uncharacterized protein